MSKSKTPIALIAERTNKNQAYVRNFIKRHPEFEIKKNSSNRIVMTQNQQDEICNAIQDEIAEREKEKEKKKEKENYKHEMSKKEVEDWDELYKYVKFKVLGYDENQNLSKNAVLRLKGMLSGKPMERKSTKNKANYSYEVVLNAFKYSMPDIRRALNNVSFENETHKFFYITRIVESNLNTVYMRMKRAEKVKKEVIKETSTVDNHKAVEYKPIKKTIKKDKFSDLW